MSRFLSNPYYSPAPEWGDEPAAAFDSRDVAGLHQSIAEYQPTPLIELPALARKLRLGRLLVKDEAHRFGLKAFKALGATYATYRYLQTYLQEKNRPCPSASQFFRQPNFLVEHELTFCTATDGNHGRGVAWVARRLGQKAVIYMPAGTVRARIENIEHEGAEVINVDGTYDEAVRRCATEAEAPGWQIISDTSWAGYETIPRWIMAGYLTLFCEVQAALDAADSLDLVIVQGGVGALAGAAAWYFQKLWTRPQPKLVIVEPEEAACLIESIASPDGQPLLSAGKQDSIMAGLNCGMPSPVAWPLVKAAYNAFLTVSDKSCVEAMRTYYYPRDDDPQIVSGESGAAGLAALLTLTQQRSMAKAYLSLKLDHDSTVLLLNTEGDTDPENFSRLVREFNRQ